MTLTNEQLTKLATDEAAIKDFSTTEVLESLFPLLASVNSNEQQQVQSVLKAWITVHEDEGALSMLCEKLISDDYLFFNIGLLNSDALWKRVNSMRAIELVVDVFEQQSPLLEKLLHAVSLYVDIETDVRSFDEEHEKIEPLTVAIRVLEKLVKLLETTEQQQIKLFRLVANKVCTSSVMFLAEEQETFAAFTYTLLRAGLDEKVIEDFFVRMPKFVESQQQKLEPKSFFYLHKNLRQFLYVLHMYIYTRNEHHTLLKSIQHRTEQLTTPIAEP